MKPLIAVTGIPGLPDLLTRAGFGLVSPATDPRSVAAAVRATSAQQPVFVISAPGDEKLRTWLGFQAGQSNRLVIVLGEDPGLPKVGFLGLPATVETLMDLFGAPAIENREIAETVIDSDFSLLTPGGAADSPDFEDSEPGFDFDDPYADEDEASEGPAAPEVAPSTQNTPVEPPRALPGSPVALLGDEDDDDFDEPDLSAPSPVLYDDEDDDLDDEPFLEPVREVRNEPVINSRPVIEYDDDDDAEDELPIRAIPPVSDRSPDFDALVNPASLTPTTKRHGLAPVIIVMAGKGGVGKTSLSMSLAQRAAESGEERLRRIVLVDGNRGQGDVRKATRLLRANLPTIYDAALSQDPARAIIGPKHVAEHRDARLPRLGFGMVLAPREGQSSPSVVTTSVYAQAVAKARESADLVICDTQILEDYDTSGLWDGLWIPLLATEAWGLGLADDDILGIDNLTARFQALSAQGVTSARMMSAINRLGAQSPLQVDAVEAQFGRWSKFVGVVHQQDSVKTELATGRLPTSNPELAAVLDAVLYSVTALPAFSPERARANTKPRRSLFSRRKK